MSINDLLFNSLTPSESVTAYGSVTGDNSDAGTAIATIDSANLPAGFYNVKVQHFVSNAASPSTPDNAELRKGATSIARIQHLNAINNSTAYAFSPKLDLTVELDGSTDLSVNFVANFGGAETQTHNVLITATKIG